MRVRDGLGIEAVGLVDLEAEGFAEEMKGDDLPAATGHETVDTHSPVCDLVALSRAFILRVNH